MFGPLAWRNALTENPAGSRKPLIIIALAGCIGLAAGIGALYVKEGGKSNEASACKIRKFVTDAMAPLATGNLAAFKVNETPVKATPVTFKDGTGADKTLADFKGKTILLNLWATWCVPCREEMPALNNLEKDEGGADFAVLAVNIDTRNIEKPTQWLSDNGIDALGGYNDHTAKIFTDLKIAGKAFGMPTSLIIDKEGCELGYLAGPAEWASPEAKALVKAARAK
jgi:thiol-disulfide isomerase/thioredoxin